MREKRYSKVVPAVEQAARILYFLAERARPELTLTEIANGLGLGKSKCFTILHTLAQKGLVARSESTKGYSLGPGLRHLARFAAETPTFAKLAAPYLSGLARKTGQTALLGTVSAGRILIEASEEAGEPFGVTIRPGHTYPLEWGAHGVFFDDSNPGPLEEARKKGYSKDLGGMMKGINAVASPIFAEGGRVSGLVLLVGAFPARRADEFGILARETASILAGKLSGRP